MSEVDPIVGLVGLLKADIHVAALVADRVFGEEIPAAETDAMPRKCVVIEPSGGTQQIGRGYQDYGDGRYDFRSYGETSYEATRVQLVVARALKQLRRAVHDGVFLHWAIRVGGPVGLREPDTKWPFRFESYQVLAADVEVL